MIDADKKRFLAAMTALTDYYGKPLSTATIDLYWHGLVEFDIEQVEKAISMHVRNPDSGQWMPKIADLVKMIEGTTQDAAGQAWAKVLRAVASVGMYESLAFDDPIIHLVIGDISSWPALCQLSEAELPFLAKRFENSYRAYRRRISDLPAHPRYLIGVTEMSNSNEGFRSDPPRLVGDPRRAEQVLLNGTSAPRLQVTSGHKVADALRLVVKKVA
jgi:hypothetical protein